MRIDRSDEEILGSFKPEYRNRIRKAQKAGVARDRIDFAELDAPYAHQELILREAIGLGDGVAVNPSGGSLCTRTLFSCGLNRIGDAFARIARGDGDRAVAHATQGHCLQQNLVCVLEGE